MRWIVITAALALTSACGDNTSPTEDMSVTDTQVADASIDDAAPDTGSDSAGDSAIGDLPVVDSTVDVLGDLPTSDAAISACAAGGQAVFEYNTQMIVCTAPGGADKTQCEAASSCGPGWHLCTASEFKSRGGDGTPIPSVLGAWIAACVRDGGGTMSPTDGVCGQCNLNPASPVDIEWSCTGTPGTAQAPVGHIGVTAGSICRRLGQNLPANGAFWLPTPAGAPLAQAVCCSN